MRIEASAPSNIALIKYMGKGVSGSNLPANVSMSYTLENMRTFVTIESGTEDTWLPLEGYAPLSLSDAGRKKFLDHFSRLKARWSITGQYTVRSANNFPSDCGLASSASSFAALTLATWQLAVKTGAADEDTENAESLSRLSRLGSGSSCRSFFSPWSMWRGEGAQDLSLTLKLDHAVIIIEKTKKEVSSTEAHRRIESSLLYAGRSERATTRMEELLSALRQNHWESAYELCWNEFIDMHALFETSRPAFGYMGAATWDVLTKLRADWTALGDGPLITLDAGPNIHLLYRPEQRELAERQLTGLNVIKSWK